MEEFIGRKTTITNTEGRREENVFIEADEKQDRKPTREDSPVKFGKGRGKFRISKKAGG